MIKGKVRMRTKNGSHDYEAHQAFDWGPGHAPEALEDSEYVDFSPTAEFERVISHFDTRRLTGRARTDEYRRHTADSGRAPEGSCLTMRMPCPEGSVCGKRPGSKGEPRCCS